LHGQAPFRPGFPGGECCTRTDRSYISSDPEGRSEPLAITRSILSYWKRPVGMHLFALIPGQGVAPLLRQLPEGLGKVLARRH